MQYQLLSPSAILSLSSSSLLLPLLTAVEESKIDLEGKFRLSYDDNNSHDNDYY
jgi:hypothetical protein